MLERNRKIQEAWYEIFKDRVHLLVPKSVKVDDRQVLVDDVVLFVFDDGNVPKLWEWRLGIVTEVISRTTVVIRYVTKPGGRPRLINRSVRQVSVIVPVDQLPPTHSEFFDP